MGCVFLLTLVSIMSLVVVFNYWDCLFSDFPPVSTVRTSISNISHCYHQLFLTKFSSSQGWGDPQRETWHSSSALITVIWCESNVIQHISSDICDTLYLFKFFKSYGLCILHLTTYMTLLNLLFLKWKPSFCHVRK